MPSRCYFKTAETICYGLLCLLVFAGLLLTLTAQAQTSRILEYHYDDAGNLIRITTLQSQGEPIIDNLSPSAIALDTPTLIVATGTNLDNAQVTTDDPGLTVSNVTSTPVEVRFTLTAADTVPLGAHLLTFTTALGSTDVSIDVVPEQIELFLAPVPVVVSTSNIVTLILELAEPAPADYVVNLIPDDTSIATANPSSVTIPAGQRRPSESVQVVGVNLGSTPLTLEVAAPVYQTTIFVTPPFVPIFDEEYGAVSQSIGVLRGDLPVPTTPVAPLSAPLVGVMRQETVPTVNVSPLLGPLVGVVREDSSSSTTTVSPLIAPLVGVERQTGSSAMTVVSPLIAPLVGVERLTP